MFLSFRNIINVFELVGYLKNSISQLGSSIFEFCEKNQPLFELFIEFDLLTLTEIKLKLKRI